MSPAICQLAAQCGIDDVARLPAVIEEACGTTGVTLVEVLPWSDTLECFVISCSCLGSGPAAVRILQCACYWEMLLLHPGAICHLDNLLCLLSHRRTFHSRAGVKQRRTHPRAARGTAESGSLHCKRCGSKHCGPLVCSFRAASIAADRAAQRFAQHVFKVKTLLDSCQCHVPYNSAR